MKYATFLGMNLYGGPFTSTLFNSAGQSLLIQYQPGDIYPIATRGGEHGELTGFYLRMDPMEEDSVEFMMGPNANPVNLTSVGKVYLVPSYIPGAGAEAARAVRQVMELVVGGSKVAAAVKKVGSPHLSLTPVAD